MADIEADSTKKVIYKLVLTGGPCGGKTTGQERLAAFFENLGWKVFTVPEAATILLRGGIKFNELNPEQIYIFEKDLLNSVLQLEKVFFNQAEMIADKNVLIICDRGTMDPSSYMNAETWEKVLQETGYNIYDLRDTRYNQIIHLVTAAEGAESYYTLKNNIARSEGIKEAVAQDHATRNAWVGHPCVDFITNSDSTSFNEKILQLIQLVCMRIGLPPREDRLGKNSRKRKWLVRSFDLSRFPKFEEFDVRHDFLLTKKQEIQARIRERKQNNYATYSLTIKRKVNKEEVETRTHLKFREYLRYKAMRDPNRAPLHKKRRCFNYGDLYFNLDEYVPPLPGSRVGMPLKMLETYTTKTIEDAGPELPEFIEIEREISGDPCYSMYMLSRNSTNSPQ